MMTLYAAQRVQDSRLHGDSLGAPATWYLAMGATVQDTAEGGTECADANYAREAISWNAWSAGANTNNGAVTFASTNGLAAGFDCYSLWLCDSLSGGNTWEYYNFPSPVSFSAGQSPRLANATMSDSIS